MFTTLPLCLSNVFDQLLAHHSLSAYRAERLWYGTFAWTIGGLSVHKVYYGKMADWIQMPFGVVSGVSRGMGVLDWGGRLEIVEEEGAGLGMNAEHRIVTNGVFATWLFPDYFGQDLCYG